MSEQIKTEKHQFEDLAAANQYVENVRQLYREDKGTYAGRRTEDQQIIAELAGEEARLIVDGAAALGAISLAGADGLPADYEDYEYAGVKWSEFRDEFERLLVGFGVITNRLHRDGHKVKGEAIPDYLELDDNDRIKAASILFSDFLEHNALRLGVDGSGVQRTYASHNDEGGITRELRDKDVVTSEKELRENLVTRGYSTGVATHPAGKISPAEYKKLRKEFPEIDKDRFDNDVSFYRDVAEQFAERGQ